MWKEMLASAVIFVRRGQAGINQVRQNYPISERSQGIHQQRALLAARIDTVCSRSLEQGTSRARIMSGAKGLEGSHNTTQELRKGMQRPKSTYQVCGKPHKP